MPVTLASAIWPSSSTSCAALPHLKAPTRPAFPMSFFAISAVAAATRLSPASSTSARLRWYGMSGRMARLHDVPASSLCSFFSFVTVEELPLALGDMYIDRIFDAQKSSSSPPAPCCGLSNVHREKSAASSSRLAALWIGAIINAVATAPSCSTTGRMGCGARLPVPSRGWSHRGHLSSSGPTAAVSTISDTHADLA